MVRLRLKVYRVGGVYLDNLTRFLGQLTDVAPGGNTTVLTTIRRLLDLFLVLITIIQDRFQFYCFFDAKFLELL